MKFSPELENSIKVRDITGIRAALIAYLDAGCTENALDISDEVKNLLHKEGIELFDVDDARFTSTNDSDLKADLRKLKAALRLNFSREKISLGTVMKNKLEDTSDMFARQNSSTAFNAGEYETETSSTNASKVVSGNSSSDLVQTVEPTEVSIREFKTSHSKTTDFDSTTLPDDLEKAVNAGEVSTVKSILMGYLDIFDKTEAIPVIQYAAICKDKLSSQKIELFVADDGRFDFENAPLSAESLRSIKAKLRLNFSLEKMIFAEKIFQIEMEKRAEDISKEEKNVYVEKQPLVVAASEEVEKAPEVTNINATTSVSSVDVLTPIFDKPVAETTEHDAYKKTTAVDNATSKDNTFAYEETYTDSHSESYNHQKRQSQPHSEQTIKIEIVYKPGPLEHLFGQIGRFFDCMFNNKGKRIERPYRRK